MFRCQQKIKCEEYEKIEKIFEEARKDILNVVASLEFINRRIDSIKIGAKNIELLLDKDFNKKLQEVKSLDGLESIINKMIEIVPLVNEDEEKYKSNYDAGKNLVNCLWKLIIL